MPHRKRAPSVESESDAGLTATRMTTRPRNATAHPGYVVRESSRTHRDKEEIQDEKNQKRVRKAAKLKQLVEAEAMKAEGRAFVAQCEAEDTAAVAKSEFPRHRAKKDVSAQEVPKAVGKRRAVTPTEGTPPKKVRHAPLRRTETMLQDVLLAEAQDDPVSRNHEDTDTDDDLTPRPTKKKPSDNNFQTSLTLKKSKFTKPSFINKGDSSLSELSEDDTDDGKGKKKSKKKGKAKVTAADTDAGSTTDTNAEEPPDSKLKKIDFHLSRKTSANSNVVLKSAGSDSAHSAASKPSRSAAPKPAHVAAPKPSRSAAPEPAHVAAPKSSCSAASEPAPVAAPKSSGNAASEPAHVAAPKSCSVVSEPTHVATPNVTAPNVTAPKSSRNAASKPAHVAAPKSSRSVASQPGHVATPPSRNAASEPAHIAAPKPSRSSAPKPRPAKSVVAPRSGGIGDDQKENRDCEFEPAVGGLMDEDDSLERDVAMSSPFKGKELQMVKKSIIKGQGQDTGKTRKRAMIQDLPDGAHDDAAWVKLVIPNFIRLIMAGDQAWLINDEVIISDLQVVWNHVYGRRVPLKIKKGTAAFDLAVQKLYDYRGKIAQKALYTVVAYLYEWCYDENDPEMDFEEIEKLAKEMLANHDTFLFRGMEDERMPKKMGTFRHILILETLSTHFTTYMQGRQLKGLEIGDAIVSLALAAAAVERALQLLAQGLIENRPDAKGRNKLCVQKTNHPNTGVPSSISTEFSAQGWNKITMEYLQSVKQLSKKKLAVIFDEAKELVPNANDQEELADSYSGHATLCSDEEN